MNFTYKVWVQVEEVDHEANHYENVTEPECLACFSTQEEAEEFVAKLPNNPEL